MTLRHDGRLPHIGIGIGIGRTHARTRVILLVQDLDIRVVNAPPPANFSANWVLDPRRDYQPAGAPKGRTRTPPK